MIKFAWHSEVHSRAGSIVLTAGTVIYAAGSVLMARPYVSHPATLLIAVPVTTAVGMLALGVLALVVAALYLVLANDLDGGFGGEIVRKRKDRR